jgi:hypothetical protein
MLLTYPVYSLAALTLLMQPRFRADAMNPGLAREMLGQVVAELGGGGGRGNRGEGEGEGGKGEENDDGS